MFLIAGVALVVWSLFIDSLTVSAVISITGFSSRWSIHELVEQEERVKKGMQFKGYCSESMLKEIESPCPHPLALFTVTATGPLPG